MAAETASIKMATVSALIKMAMVFLVTSAGGEIVDDIVRGLAAREREMYAAPHDDHSEKEEFDFIVVGAGAGGCTVAGRLSEEKEWSVLLLEAGGDETFAMDIPFFPGAGAAPFIDWGYTAAPQPHGGCPGGPDKECPFPRGKVMGGSTVLNFMLNVRGNKEDFDNWARLGAEGWDYRNVLPYFRKMENVQIAELRGSAYHGTDGPVYISIPYESAFSPLAQQRATALRIPILDFNGANQTGFGRAQSFTFKGARWSANKAYLFPAANRSNFYVRKYSLVSKVLVHRGRAVGVEYLRNGTTHRAFARKEVILSAGSVNTAQILMLSGIGPRAHLQDLGIPVVQDLPVGDYLVDHSIFMGLLITFENAPFPTHHNEVLLNISVYQEYFANGTGPLSSLRNEETVRFIEIGPESVNKSWPIIEVLAFSQPNYFDKAASDRYGFDDEFYDKFIVPVRDKQAIQPILFNLRPKSNGTLRLKSKSINDKPIIDPNYFDNPVDVNITVEGVKRTIEFFTGPPFAGLGAKLYDTPIPKCEQFTFGSDEYWSCAVRWASTTVYHPCCTAKMGAADDRTAVLTPDLRVKGVRGLRVVDTSVMPAITSGHLTAPTLMLAEKAADIIKCAHRGRPGRREKDSGCTIWNWMQGNGREAGEERDEETDEED